jgi:hypothetical protein
MWPCITVMVVVAEVLIFAAIVVHTTGSTDSLKAIGDMVTRVLAALAKVVAALSGGG